jgi:hypothetical protein
LPVSVTPLETITNPPANTTPLAHLPELASKAVTVLGYRLPGWTGGTGFYLGDGHTFILARGGEALKSPPAWQPVVIQGRWLKDAFGTAWLQVDRLTTLPAD